MDLRVKLNVFEGPFDLLLHLIKISEMDIYDVRIAEITHQYLEYVTAMEDLNLEIAGEYLVMAATLLNLKSRQILPARPSDEEDMEEEIDELMSTRELIRRLVEYRDIKDMAQDLRQREREHAHVFFRSGMPDIPVDSSELPRPQMREDIQNLFDAFVRVLRQLEIRREHTVGTENYKVEDKIDHITTLLTETKMINALELFRRCLVKQEIIVTFMAILELCKLGKINVRQQEGFQDIFIEGVEDNDKEDDSENSPTDEGSIS